MEDTEGWKYQCCKFVRVFLRCHFFFEEAIEGPVDLPRSLKEEQVMLATCQNMKPHTASGELMA